jgi:acyl-CoA synthetase (AMP-forming)/AMP-acid ligase II
MQIAGDLLGERARLTPDRTALVYVPTGERFTYAELDARAVRLAFFAAAKAGVILVPLGTRKPSIGLVMAELSLPPERAHTVMEEWGYTGSACVPMALHDAREKGKIRPGGLVVLVGPGVGYNQAAVAFRARG